MDRINKLWQAFARAVFNGASEKQVNGILTALDRARGAQHK